MIKRGGLNKKYFGPCPIHNPPKTHHCKHCKAIDVRRLYNRPYGESYARAGIPIYPLHWPVAKG